MVKSKVFEETYNFYLSELQKIDFSKCSSLIGAHHEKECLNIRFFNKTYSVSKNQILSPENENITFAIKVVLSKYILMCPDNAPDHNPQYVTYREFKDAGPLISYFANNTNKTIESNFSGKLPILEEKCEILGGIKKNSDTYDLSYLFFALPKIPVVLNFNDADEMFPAGCSILYEDSAEKYLDMECLAITGTFLTGLLIQ